MIDAGQREALVERFREYLEGVAEGPGEAQEEPERVDLFTLFTELANLRNEVRLESRQVRQALDHSAELIDGLRENNRQLAEELGRQRQAESERRTEAERPLLLDVLDLRDRMQAGLDALRAYRPRRLAGRAAQRLIQAQAEGMAIGLRRLDGLLARYRVRPIDCVGARLDPLRMRVAATEEQARREDGEVLAEVRRGYLRGEEVLRLAEVVVNKRAEGI